MSINIEHYQFFQVELRPHSAFAVCCAAAYFTAASLASFIAAKTTTYIIMNCAIPESTLTTLPIRRQGSRHDPLRMLARGQPPDPPPHPAPPRNEIQVVVAASHALAKPALRIAHAWAWAPEFGAQNPPKLGLDAVHDP